MDFGRASTVLLSSLQSKACRFSVEQTVNLPSYEYEGSNPSPSTTLTNDYRELNRTSEYVDVLISLLFLCHTCSMEVCLIRKI